MAVDPLVTTVVNAYSARLDAEAPGLLQGLYLVGSVAMDDFRRGGPLVRRGPSGAGASDIDFVAVTSRPVSPSSLTALERVHRHLTRRHRRPVLEGMYLTWDDLADGPPAVGEYARAHGGIVRLSPGGSASPVIWHELVERGVSVRGPHRSRLAVWTDREARVGWYRTNLQKYWGHWHQRGGSCFTGPGLAGLSPFGPAWAVLGVSRTHYTATTGDLISKTGAGSTHGRSSTVSGAASLMRPCASALAQAGGRCTPTPSAGAAPPLASSTWCCTRKAPKDDGRCGRPVNDRYAGVTVMGREAVSLPRCTFSTHSPG